MINLILEEEWDSVTEEAKDLIKNMLKYAPKDRFSAEQSLSHKWFKKFETVTGKLPGLNSNTISNIKKFHVRYGCNHRTKTNFNKLLYLI